MGEAPDPLWWPAPFELGAVQCPGYLPGQCPLGQSLLQMPLPAHREGQSFWKLLDVWPLSLTVRF